MGGLNPAGGHSCMELLARPSHTSSHICSNTSPHVYHTIPLALCTPSAIAQTCDPISPSTNLQTHCYTFALLNAFSLQYHHHHRHQRHHHHQSQHYHHSPHTHRYIFILLNVFSLLPPQSPIGRKVGIAEVKREKRLQVGMIILRKERCSI